MLWRVKSAHNFQKGLDSNHFLKLFDGCLGSLTGEERREVGDGTKGGREGGKEEGKEEWLSCLSGGMSLQMKGEVV